MARASNPGRRQRAVPGVAVESARPAPASMRAAPWIVAAVALLAYANSLSNGFVWDDPIILDRQLVVFRSAGDVLAPPRDIPQFSPDYYRPLTIASYLLDRAVGGEAPFAFHLSVVFAHAITSVMVYCLAVQLIGARRAGMPGALAAGLLFALHPIHTESVAWAAGRSDVLATGFVAAALVVHGWGGAWWRTSLLSGVCAAGALGAKETGIAVYPLLLLRDVVCPPLPASREASARRLSLGSALRSYAGVAVAGVIYVLLRRNALGEFVGSAPQDAPVHVGAAQLLAAFGTYLQKLVWPVELNAYIDRLDVAPVPLALALGFTFGLAFAGYRWLTTRTDGVPLFALVWIVLTLVPSLAILWKIPDAPLAERYLYLPSVGFSLLIGDLAGRALESLRGTARTAALAAAGAVLLAAAAGTIMRNPVWHDDVALWEDTEAKSQTSGMAARSLGTAYQQAGRAAEARAAFERALTRRNNGRGLQTIRNNLGTLAMFDGDFAAARAHYEAALAANPNAADTIFNLGLAILQQGGGTADAARQALPHFERARAINPHDPDVEAGLGQVYVILGDKPRARLHLERALTMHPNPRAEQGIRQLLAEAGA